MIEKLTVSPAEADRSGFLAERHTCIGGSDAASLFSAGNYGCLRRLFYQKRGTPADSPDDDSPILRRGRKLERIALEEFAEATGRRVEYVGLTRHPLHPEIAAHQDAAEWADDHDGPGTVEVKCLGRESFFRAKREGMIEDYLLQIQHGMLAAGTNWGTFVLFWPDGFQLLWFDIAMDAQLCALILETGIDVWRRIQDPNEPLPERLDASDRRCGSCRWQRTCQGARLLELIGDAARESDVEFDATLAPLAAEYSELKQIATDATALSDEAGDRLRAAIGDRQAADTNGFRIYYRASKRTTVDTARLKKEMPEIAAKFTKETITRALRIYARGE